MHFFHVIHTSVDTRHTIVSEEHFAVLTALSLNELLVDVPRSMSIVP